MDFRLDALADIDAAVGQLAPARLLVTAASSFGAALRFAIALSSPRFGPHSSFSRVRPQSRADRPGLAPHGFRAAQASC